MHRQKSVTFPRNKRVRCRLIRTPIDRCGPAARTLIARALSAPSIHQRRSQPDRDLLTDLGFPLAALRCAFETNRLHDRAPELAADASRIRDP
jgi:hypothetical protein